MYRLAYSPGLGALFSACLSSGETSISLAMGKDPNLVKNFLLQSCDSDSHGGYDCVELYTNEVIIHKAQVKGVYFLLGFFERFRRFISSL